MALLINSLEYHLELISKRILLPEANIPDKLRERIRITDNLCWIWKGATSGKRKYPTLKLNNHRIHVLKFFFKYFKLPLNIGLLKQKCGNKLCVNPWHSWSSRHSSICFRGHFRTKENTHITIQGTKICKICVSLEKK